MPLSGIRLIIDTNTLLRGLAKPSSTSGRIVSEVAARRVLLLTSNRIIDEYRVILMDEVIIAKYPSLTAKSVEASIRSLVYLSEHLSIPRASFEFPRDPKDEKFLTLAIAGKATHLVTFDKDLLSLSRAHSDAAKRLRQRLPGLKIVMPVDFMDEVHGLH